ncbi:MAG: hypothetical protein JNJ45_06800 [Chthonomonas sp.]|nr:hypothetical protein [Chthonomonas sp.]
MSVRADHQVQAAVKSRPWITLLPGYTLYCLIKVVALPFSLIRERRRRKRGMTGAGRKVRMSGGTPIAPHGTIIEANGLGETRVGLVAYDQIEKHSARVALMVQKDPAFALGQTSGRVVGYSAAHNPFSALLFLAKARPREIIFIETCSNYHLAFWARVCRVPTALISVNVSEHLAHRMRRNVLGAWRMNLAERIYAQGEGYAQRLRQSGVWPEIVHIGGVSLPQSIPTEQEVASLAEKWRRILQILPDQPVILAGSTYEEDDALIVQAFGRLDPALNAILVVAPRHLHRSMSAYPNAVHRSKLAEEHRGNRRIVILDTSGELGELYALANVAHIGGTQSAKLGGHTPVEPLTFGVPFTTGPEYGRQEPVTLAALQSGAAWLTCTPQEMAIHWESAIRNPGLRHLAKQTFMKLIEENRDVFARMYIAALKGRRG